MTHFDNKHHSKVIHRRARVNKSTNQARPDCIGQPPINLKPTKNQTAIFRSIIFLATHCTHSAHRESFPSSQKVALVSKVQHVTKLEQQQHELETADQWWPIKDVFHETETILGVNKESMKDHNPVLYIGNFITDGYINKNRISLSPDLVLMGELDRSIKLIHGK